MELHVMLDNCKNKKSMFNHIVTGKFRDSCRTRKKISLSPLPLVLPDIQCLVCNKAKKTSWQEKCKIVYHK